LYLQQALTLSLELGYLRGTGRSYLWQARVYYYKDEYPMAESYLARAKEVLDRAGDRRDLAFWHFACASLHDLNGNLQVAVKEYQEVVRLAGLAGDESLRATSLVSLGAISNSMKEPDNALDYFRRALAIQQRIGEQPGVASTYNNIGASFEAKGLPDSALFYYRRGYQIRLAGKDDRSVASSEYSLGSLFIRMTRYPEAIALFESARDRYLRLDEKTGLCMVHLELARALNPTGKEKAARDAALYALEIARRLENPALTLSAYETLAELSASRQQYQDAYRYAVRARELGDTLNRKKKERVIKEMEARFRLQQVGNEMEQLVLRDRVQRKNILLLSVSIAALLAALGLTILLYRQKTLAHRRQRMLFDQEAVIRKQREALAEKEKELLQKKVETQERELAAKALEMLRVNETLGSILDRLQHLHRANSGRPDLEREIGHIVREIEHHTQHHAWQEFDTIFRNIHHDFYDRLLAKCPDLTAAEIKIAALLKLNLSTKEIAAITLKSEEGIKSTRYRLRKKLQFTSDEHLIPFLLKL